MFGKLTGLQVIIIYTFVIISLISSCFIFGNDRLGYEWLFLLPLSFAINSLFFYKTYLFIPSNLGATLIIGLFFIRLVVSPLLLYLGGFSTVIFKNVVENTPYAILLLCYECTAIFITFNYLSNKYRTILICKNNTEFNKTLKFKIKNKYKFLFAILVLILVCCFFYTPQLNEAYRTIFNITEENFTSVEDTDIVNKYAVSFSTKLSIVTGNYLMRLLTILIPAIFIISLSSSKNILKRNISILLIFVPLFFISGAIARSLISFVILYLLRSHLVGKESNRTNILILIVAVVAVLAWWSFRATTKLGFNPYTFFSSTLNAYFSGVNTLSGVFNMERDLVLRMRYFMYDFFAYIPYSGTIFNFSHEYIAPFFNNANLVRGQIVPTIGMGWYYFGPIFAPIYSVIYTIIVVNAGVKLQQGQTNPIKYLRLLIVSIYFSLGIVMYSIAITMTHFWMIIVPLYLLEKFSSVKDNNSLYLRKIIS